MSKKTKTKKEKKKKKKEKAKSTKAKKRAARAQSIHAVSASSPVDEPLTEEIVTTGDWEIDIAGERVRARASLRPMFDPRMERVKC